MINMSFNKENYQKEKIEDYRKAKAEREAMRPRLEAIKDRQERECEICFGAITGCSSPRHWN